MPRMSWTTMLIAAAVALGLGLRTYHFARNPDVWHDEAAMIVSILRVPVTGWLGPMLFDEAAPPLFFLVQKGVITTMGAGTYALRTLPYLASCISLVGLTLWTLRVLNPWSALFVAVFMGCSDRMLFHACEAKSYSVDVLIAVAALWITCWPGRGALWQRLLVSAAFWPVALWLSFPSCFLCGASMLSLLLALGRDGETSHRWRALSAYSLCVATIATSFLWLFLGPVRAQRTGPLEQCWVEYFPDLTDPFGAVVWSIWSTVEIVGYSFRPIGQPLFFLLAIGVFALLRSRRYELIVAAVMPAGLTWFASLIGAYPYGGARVTLFASAGLLVASAWGFSKTVEWLREHQPMYRWVPACLLVAMAISPAMVIFQPWNRPANVEASKIVLERIQPDDRIAFNAWEHSYYLGEHEQNRVDIERMNMNPVSPDRRVWMLVTANTPESREHIIRTCSPRTHALDRRWDLNGISVLLFENKANVADLGGESSLR